MWLRLCWLGSQRSGELPWEPLEDAREGSAALPAPAQPHGRGASAQFPAASTGRRSRCWERSQVEPQPTGTQRGTSLLSAERQQPPFSQAPKHFVEKLPLKQRKCKCENSRRHDGSVVGPAVTRQCWAVPGLPAPLRNRPVPDTGSWTKGSKAGAVMPSLGWLHGTAPLAAPGTSQPLSPSAP